LSCLPAYPTIVFAFLAANTSHLSRSVSYLCPCLYRPVITCSIPFFSSFLFLTSGHCQQMLFVSCRSCRPQSNGIKGICGQPNTAVMDCLESRRPSQQDNIALDSPRQFFAWPPVFGRGLSVRRIERDPLFMASFRPQPSPYQDLLFRLFVFPSFGLSSTEYIHVYWIRIFV
jgi:hypothetical protein